jgi:hypothetical protein
MISLIDEEQNELKFCPRFENDICNELIKEINVLNECVKYCPKDSIEFNVQRTHVHHIFSIGEETNATEGKIFWGKNFPLISYIETRFMKLTGMKNLHLEDRRSLLSPVNVDQHKMFLFKKMN